MHTIQTMQHMQNMQTKQKRQKMWNIKICRISKPTKFVSKLIDHLGKRSPLISSVVHEIEIGKAKLDLGICAIVDSGRFWVGY